MFTVGVGAPLITILQRQLYLLSEIIINIPGESKKRPAFEGLLLPEYIGNYILQYLINHVQLFLEIFLTKIGHSVPILWAIF